MGKTSCNRIAIVWPTQVGGGTERMIDSRSKPGSERISCKDQAEEGLGTYVLNRYSRIPGTQPHEYQYRIPPGEPCIRQEHVHMQGYCIHKTG